MAPTYPDWSRMQKAQGVPPYAEEENFWPPYKKEVPILFSPNPKYLPVRTRVSAHRVDADYITKYNRAVQGMKELPPEDPRNFIQQANVHAAYCHACYFMDTTEKRFSVHAGWFFLPWHRWFLYFHERIMGKLLEDDTFALPYWDWDFEEGMTIPPIYLNKENTSLFDPRRNAAHGPASLVDLNFHTGKRPLPDRLQIACNYRLMHRQMVSGAKSTRAFHGAPRRSSGPDSGCTCAAGTLETSPHKNVHNWVGIPVKEECQSHCPSRTCYGEDMGIFYSAGRDPIFYAHHANVDRMWTIWQQDPEHKDYDDPYLLDTMFLFYDENARLVSVRAGDAYDPARLGNRYEHSPTPWLVKQPNPEPIPAVNALELPALPRNNITLHHAGMVTLPWPRGDGEGEEILLSIQGIHVPRNLSVKLDFFVNLDHRLVPTPYVDSVPREFAATFVALPRGSPDGAEEGCGRSSLLVGISDVLRDLNVEEGEEVAVTLLAKGISRHAHHPIAISSIKLIRETL